MKLPLVQFRFAALAMALGCACSLVAQTPDNPPARDDGFPRGGFPPPGEGPESDGPPPFGPGGFGRGGPGRGGFGGPMRQELKLVKQFDKDGNKQLNAAERRAAREYLTRQGGNRGPGGRGGRRGGFGGFGESQTEPKPGPKISPADVKSFPDAPLYAPNVLRTFFLEFEEADWEKELQEFHGTDVEVPAKLTVDGKAYPDVGVHFRGMSSYMMVGEGSKRSLNLSLDFAHPDQQIGGYRTLNLLNAHEDSTFLRTVLFYDIAREYIPAPKANLVRVVINGESWGVYVSAQQFNKDFVKDWFGTTKGARWKVPGSPGGQGSLAYLGDDATAYKRVYQIKSKDDPKSWASLVRLCKVLNETAADQLELALQPLLDIDGALKFLAIENALVNNDGYWVRSSDYDICQDEKGRFHIIPYDANETFSMGGGPGGPGGFRGRSGRFGGPGDFGPGMFVAAPVLTQADKNGDQNVTKSEFTALADAWFDTLDSAKTGKLNPEQFTAKLGDVLAPPPGPDGSGSPDGGAPGFGPGPGGGPGGFGPAIMLGSPLFTAADASKDDSLTRAELNAAFTKWFGEWDADKTGVLNEEKLRIGFNTVWPRADFGGPGGGFGGRGGRRGFGGPGAGGGFGGGGVQLDPLVAANNPSKPLISKLLAVPSLRARYLGHVRDIANTWLDWKTLGPRATQYQSLIADEVKTDTRNLSSFEAFQTGVTGDTQAGESPGPASGGSLKSFAEQRRKFLLEYKESKPAQE